MKTLFAATVLLLCAMTVCGQDIRDTAWAGRLMREAVELTNVRKYEEALGKLDTARVIYLKTKGDTSNLYATCLFNIGNLFCFKNQIDTSIMLFKKSLLLKEKRLPSSHADIGLIYYKLAYCYGDQKEYDLAISCLKKALEILSSDFKSYAIYIGFCYDNIGFYLWNKGSYNEALKYQQKALQINIENFGHEDPKVALTYNNIGLSLQDKGDINKSISFHKKALAIRLKKFGQKHNDVAQSYNNLGICYRRIGALDRAITYHNQALEIRKIKLGPEHTKVAFSYNNLGLCYSDKTEYDTSIYYHEKALEIRQKKLLPDDPYLAYSYYNIGQCFLKKKNFEKALSFFQKSLDIRLMKYGPQNSFVANSFYGIGNFYYDYEDYLQAIDFYNKALLSLGYSDPFLFQAIQNFDIFMYSITNKASACYKYYSVSGRVDYLENAVSVCEEGLSALRYSVKNSTIEDQLLEYESNRILIKGAIFINILYSKVVQNVEPLKKAFTILENGGNILLRQSLRESDALHFAGIPDSLLQREYDLRVDIAYYDKKRFEEEIEKKKPITDSILLAINSKLFDLKRAYEALKDTFEQQYPDYYRLKYDLQVESVENVQQSLPPDQALLEYFVGDSSIFIFLVKKNDYRAIEVKKDFPLEDWVKQLRHGIYGYHTADPNQKTDDLRDSCANEYIESATALYQKLLAPVDSLLPRRVVIVPDGALGYIPFEALLTDRPKRANRFHEYPYFGGQTGTAHSISYCYSATLLREMTTRQHRQTPGKSFLAYAPYYDGDTTLLASRSIDPNNPANRLPPLKYATEEVEALHDIMGGKAVIGRSARKDSLIQEAGQYRIVHLSTHGKANDKVGDYSFLAFSEVKDSVDNEWLYVRDIYNLSLNADMVVLSACETGIGELKRGEGIISLARAFAYAGAKSIVTTLWSVDDAKTKDLMVFFYRNLKQGMTKDEALAKARSDYFEKYKSGDAHPFFWAGFIGIGDMGAFK